MSIDNATRHKLMTARDLARRGSAVSPDLSCATVVSLFLQDRDICSIVVLDSHERAIGILRRLDVLARASVRFFPELYGERPCSSMMDTEMTVVDVAAPLDEMSSVVGNMREAHLIDGFIVTDQGQYYGSGRFSDLLRAVSEQQIAFARYANPLTLLPGNTAVDAKVDRLLAVDVPFRVAYFDLDHFKPFNDAYGYKQGDEVIRLCARLIQQELDPALDFLGHIGGDDFVAVMRSTNWEMRIKAVLAHFDLAVRDIFTAAHVAAGGYSAADRAGNLQFHPITSLSVGVVSIRPGDYHRHAEVSQQASDAKKQAKKTQGSSYFVERRRARSTGGG